ncbi:ABC transporter ATP-binding protein [Nocardioides marmoribigeumensis]|uniref:Glutathione import ATP-binding protein GsiA n=1 Tax=Nocardioides marmoribigeumensis TaxID=433649 RepID=A0ABU2C172_9ACTN|nr:ABC transporter ATP-binding protein [Nocardioides marmoribigeumensis]MDR7364405.1 peptide/nickel transport system ATP-binding protein [Nocardioides marmoribigeumensis]
MPTKPETASAPARTDDVLMELDDLAVHYQLRGGSLARLLGRDTGTVKAVDGVDIDLRKGEVLGLVGESGSGKTTLGRALLGLVRPTQGAIRYHHGDGGTTDLAECSAKRLRELRTDLQMVFQDPHAALNPSMDLETAVGHPLRIHGIASGDELRRRVVAALERVGLAPAEQFLRKYPSDLSGGQKQRAVIARAVILDPELLVADEPISMLDMSVRAKILQLMLDLKDDLGLTYVYITHDLATAKFFCDRVAIMYLGRIVEIGPTQEIFEDPKHPYTKALLKAIPEPDPTRMVPRDLPRGEIPDAASPPLGCSFHPRCPEATSTCGWESRDLRALLEEHWTRRDSEVYLRERSLVGDLEVFDRPATEVTFGGADPDGARRLVEEIRSERPDEPLWKGVEDISSGASGVTVRFAEGEDPALRRAGGVDVACVLYADESSGSPTAER